MACNRLHEVEQRLARWLLMCQDRFDSQSLPLTHEFLAQMLGSGRPTVSLAAGALESAGLIENLRGTVTVSYTHLDVYKRQVQLRGRWIVRRLAPDCSRIELASLRAPDIELRLLHAMGCETANIHLGTPTARKAILRHIAKQKGRWLHRASEDMLEAVRSDWEVWKKKGYE